MMPSHIDMPAAGAPVRTCGPKVSQRNAPGAMSAIALLVNPVRPRVGLSVGVVDGSAIGLRIGGFYGLYLFFRRPNGRVQLSNTSLLASCVPCACIKIVLTRHGLWL